MVRRLLSFATILLVSGMTFGHRTSTAAGPAWNSVHQYIENHAVYTAAGSEEMLYAEACMGIETWETFGATKAAASKNIHGTGWPSNGVAVFFATSEEAEALATLVRNATIGS